MARVIDVGRGGCALEADRSGRMTLVGLGTGRPPKRGTSMPSVPGVAGMPGLGRVRCSRVLRVTHGCRDLPSARCQYPDRCRPILSQRAAPGHPSHGVSLCAPYALCYPGGDSPAADRFKHPIQRHDRDRRPPEGDRSTNGPRSPQPVRRGRGDRRPGRPGGERQMDSVRSGADHRAGDRSGDRGAGARVRSARVRPDTDVGVGNGSSRTTPASGWSGSHRICTNRCWRRRNAGERGQISRRMTGAVRAAVNE